MVVISTPRLQALPVSYLLLVVYQECVRNGNGCLADIVHDVFMRGGTITSPQGDKAVPSGVFTVVPG